MEPGTFKCGPGIYVGPWGLTQPWAKTFSPPERRANSNGVSFFLLRWLILDACIENIEIKSFWSVDLNCFLVWFIDTFWSYSISWCQFTVCFVEQLVTTSSTYEYPHFHSFKGPPLFSPQQWASVTRPQRPRRAMESQRCLRGRPCRNARDEALTGGILGQMLREIQQTLGAYPRHPNSQMKRFLS